jgi:hypothetical protein
MGMSDLAETQRKTAQLENDVSEIYDMLAGIQRTQRRHTQTLREHTEMLTEILGLLRPGESS